MHFSRKTILVVGAALLAACGDKVTVAEYTPPVTAAKVNSVSVAPAGATLTVGQSITLTAAVNADAGVATTVTWSASAANVTVSSAGVVAAVSATPGVAVCATSTVDPGKKGCATIVVTAPATTGLTVTPSSATLNIGDKIQLTGSVQGATAAITWSSTDATKASVTATGLVTAVTATPGTAVCAAAAGFTTCATIAVNAVIVGSVTVTPSSATLFVGDELTLTASLNSSGSPATKGFTWSTSNASAVSVDAAGKIKGLAATPGAAVCATSNDDATKKGCATIIVNIVPVPQPASVSIASITTNIGGLGAPVNPSATAGQIDVTLNINPGQQTVKKVDLLIGGTVVATQTFTATEAAALRYAADQAVAAQGTFPQVVLSYNTATASSTTGAPAFLNGTYDVKAQISVAGAGGATTAAASANTSLTFANANTVATSISFSGNTANDGAGYLFRSGNMSVNVVPVIFTSGATVTAVNISYNTDVPACDLGAALARGAAGTAPAVGAFAWTATISGNATDAAAATNGSRFEYNNACASYAAGGSDIRATVIGSNGNAIVNAALIGRARLDNNAPAAATILVNAGGRSGNWINAALRFNETVANDATNGWLALNPADAGVGGRTVVAKIGADLTTSIASATTYTTAASLTPTNDNVSQCIVLYSRDALGNSTASPDPTLGACGAGAVQPSALYGFDNVAPTAAFSSTGSLGSNTRRTGATLALNWRVTAVDNGTVGNSGMNATTPVWGIARVRNTAGTTCVVSDPATLLTTCTEANVVNNAARINALHTPAAGAANIIVAAETVNGYYTATARVMDAAGNFSAAVSRVAVLDNVLASVTTVSLTNAANNNTGFTFSALASDNLDLQNYRWAFDYAGVALGGFFDLDPVAAGVQAPLYWRETLTRTTINAYNAATFLNSNVMLSGTTSLPLALQGTVVGSTFGGAALPFTSLAAYSALDKLSNVYGETRDQGSNTTLTPSAVAGSITVPATGWLAGLLALGTGAAPGTDTYDIRFSMLSPTTGSYNSNPSSIAQTFCSGSATRDNGAAAGCQAVSLPLVPEPASISIRFQAAGVTGQYAQPYARVIIVGSTGITGGASSLLTLGTLTTVTLSDNGQSRQWRYDGTLTMDATAWDNMGGCSIPSAALGNCAATGNLVRNIYAVAVDANGRIGVVSQPFVVTVKE